MLNKQLYGGPVWTIRINIDWSRILIGFDTIVLPDEYSVSIYVGPVEIIFIK